MSAPMPLNSTRARTLLKADGGAALLADWKPAIFVHLEINPLLLQPYVPFPLDLWNGKAHVSLVAFTQHDLRPAVGGRVAALLSKPLATHHFLNLRTYVRVNGEPGIHFLAEWIPNRLATLLGPRLYGLPYHLGRVALNHRDDRTDVSVCSDAGFAMTMRLPKGAEPNEAEQDRLAEHLVERYSAFTMHSHVARRFRIWHQPWSIRPIVPGDVHITLPALLEAFPWFSDARLVAAAFSPGVERVEIGRPVKLDTHPAWHRWIPLITLPLAALFARDALSGWAFMWMLAFALYFGCKWATLFNAPAHVLMTFRRKLGYLLLWPGMKPGPFIVVGEKLAPNHIDVVTSGLTTLAGAALLFSAASVGVTPFVTGLLAMTGTTLFFHFGLFHLLALGWRNAGVPVTPIMNCPLCARSTADFWGARWNAGFHTLADNLFFRPIARRYGIAAGVMLTFLASGLVHDAVISLPAGAGYGLPTLYFLIQGVVILAERTRPLRRMPVLRRLLVGLAVVLPAPLLLFHPPFLENVMAPFADAVSVTRWKEVFTLSPRDLTTGVILVGGLLHFGILIASALTPRALGWKDELARLPVMLRKMFWVHGVFIVLVIVAFGVVSTALPHALSSGAPLARATCGFIAIFWLARLAVQFLVFRHDATPYLRTFFLRAGYHGLTVVFTWLALTYGWIALAGGR